MTIKSFMKYTLFWLLSIIVCTISTTQATFNGATVLQTLISGSTVQTWSTTKILYRWIRKNTPQHLLLQQAIDNHIIDNKKLFIPLKSEFTRDSIRRFASLYFGLSLEIYGSIPVDEDTQDEIMTSLRQAVAKRQQAYKDKIRKDIIKTINTNAIDGTISTGINTDELIKQLNDPYSTHLTGDDNRIFQQILDGAISGIGVSVFKTSESYINIAHVFSGSPAMNAGIQANDRIIKIGDKTITSEDKLQPLVSLIQWPEWTTVTLTFQRGNDIFTKTITRKKIIIEPIVISPLTADKVRMTISNFQVGIYDTFIKNFWKIKDYNTIVVDLRNNGWGSLDDTRAMLDHIVPSWEPIYHTTSDTSTTSILSQWVLPEYSLKDKKMIFLTNKYTASASEIYAGVAREYNSKNKIIGQQSFGKWSIQTIRNYSDGTTLKLTTAYRSLGKSNTSIQDIGLATDYVIIDDPLTPQDEVIEYVVNNL